MSEELKSYYINNRGFFLRPFSFKGRICRTEFAIAFVLYILLSLLFASLAGGEHTGQGALFIYYILQGVLILFYFAEAVKRCHDRNNPGAYILIPFYLLFLLFAPGDKHTNDYGNSPSSLPGDDEEFVKNNISPTSVPEEEEEDEDEKEEDAPFGTFGSPWSLMGGCNDFFF